MAKISFWKLLTDCEIVIPIIQRDYAQGRSGKEYIREKFLTQIKNALDNSNQSGELDFVYGTIKNKTFYPLDGQQRLTTLWLLHWFIASKAGQLNEAKESLKKFSYETRTSSREFCKKLCEFDISNVSNVADVIQKQKWFYAAWKQDPTIQSMLRMLDGTDIKDEKGGDFIDGIEELFNNCSQEYYKNMWNILTGICPVKFSKLEINCAELPVSDDLYIKMNARGKQLTSFENLKADLTGYIIRKYEVNEKEWTSIANQETEFAINSDTVWADVFWENKSSANSIDEIYFAFINRMFFCDLCLAKQDNIYLVKSNNENENRTYKYLNDEKSSYQSLDDYKYLNGTIPQETFKNICKVMNAVCEHYKKEWETGVFCCPWDKTFRFIPEYAKDNKGQEIIVEDKSGNRVREVTALSQPQRVVFFAICKFLKECDNDNKEELEKALTRWMRVVWNLVSVEAGDGKSVIRSFDSMRGAMELINSLDSQNIYSSLNQIELSNNSQLIQQYNEEVEKAEQIKNHPEYEKNIIEAEKYAFFNGAIRFLYRNENGKVEWDGFLKKFEHAQNYFDSDGVAEKYCKNAVLLRNFLAKAKEINFWFGNGKAFWRNKVLLDEKYKNIVSDILTNNLNEDLSKITEKEWIIDETLVADAIKLDGNAYGQWCILYDWRNNCHETLTRYAVRVSGNINHPDQVIPLNMKRNNLLGEFHSAQKRGSCYFIGWETDIKFKYTGNEFTWHEGTPCQVYWGDKSFDVQDDDTKESFREKLNQLTNCI